MDVGKKTEWQKSSLEGTFFVIDENNKAKDCLSKLLNQKELMMIVIDALASTICQYTRTVVIPGKPYFKNKVSKDKPALAGLIRFDSEKIAMELFLGLSQDLFFLLYENMFQERLNKISEENADLVAEILNIAFGVIDPKFRKLGYNLKSSFPKIYTGKKLNLAMRKILPEAIVIPYTVDSKFFFLEIYSTDCLNEKWEYDSKSPLQKAS